MKFDPPFATNIEPGYVAYLSDQDQNSGPRVGQATAQKRTIIGSAFNAIQQPENALYGFAAFYCVCLLLNWWYYLGPKSEFKNP